MSDPKYKEYGTPTIKLIEECAELIHVLCKSERFGLKCYHPMDALERSNQALIELEIADVKLAIKNWEKWVKP